MVKLKAIRERVSLAEYFGEDVYVVIKPLSSGAKNSIQEYLTNGMKVDYDAKGKASNVVNKYAAEDLDRILKIKLLQGVDSHNIPNEDGTIPEWNDALIAEIDAADPRVLETIAQKVTELSYGKAEAADADPGSPFPGSPEKKKKK